MIRTIRISMEMALEKLLLSVDETAETLNLSRNSVYELIRQGRIPAVRLGKRKLGIPRKELERVLEAKQAEQQIPNEYME